MALTSGTRFIGISPNVNLKERKSAVLNAETEPFTAQDIANFVGTGSQGPQGVQGPAGPIGPVGPAGLNWQGSWTSGTSYVADDAVGYAGASWFCILATSGTTTPNLDTTHWALLASQGAQGIQGVQGPTGAQGPSGSSAAQTNGIMYLNPSDSPYQTLSYDINRINLGGSGFSSVYLPAAAPIGKEISVFLEGGTNQLTIFGDNVLNLPFPFLMGSANQQTGPFTIFSSESYVFISLGSGLWKVNTISKTIMSGSAARTNFTNSTINGSNISIENTATLSKTTVETTKITLTKNATGLKTTNLLQAVTPTANRTIYFPDASGTVALKTYNETVILLSYDGTSFTYNNVIDELGVTITFSTFGGIIVGTLSSSVLTANKTIIWASSFLEFGGYLTQGVRNSGTSFLLALTNTNGSNTSIPTSFTDIPVRIQVYN